MLDRLSTNEPVEAARAAFLLSPYWTRSGAAIEARTRLLAILTLDLPDASRARVLYSLANVEDQLNELDAAYAHAREAVDLAEAADAPALVVDSLGMLATAAGGLGHVDEAVRVANRAVGMAEELDPTTRLHALHDLGGVLAMAGRVDEARVTLRRAADESNQVGHAIAEMYSWNNIGFLELGEREFVAARVALDRAMDLSRRVVDHNIATSSLLGLGYAELGPRTARAMPARTLRRCSIWCSRPQTSCPPTSRTPRTGSRSLPTPRAAAIPVSFAGASPRCAIARDSGPTRRSRRSSSPSPSASSGAEPKDAGADGARNVDTKRWSSSPGRSQRACEANDGGLRFGCIGKQRLTHATRVRHPRRPDDPYDLVLEDVYAWAAPPCGGWAPRLPALTISE